MTKQPSYRFAGYTEAWAEKKLGEVAEVNPKSVVPDEFKYVDLGAVVGTEMVSYRNETISTSPSRAQRLAIKGDVFYQTVRPYQKNNYLFEKDDNDYVFSTGYAQLRPSGDGCFLLSYLQTNKFVNVVLDNCTGTSYPAINSKDLSDIFISLPSLSEQTAIGSFFQDIDQLISLQQRKLEVLKEQKKTYLKLLFPAKGQKKPAFRFAGFEDEWKEVKLGEAYSFSQGQQVPVEEQFEQINENRIRFIRIVDLTNKGEEMRYIEFKSSTGRVYEKDIFFVRYGAVGVVGIGYDGIIANNLFRLNPQMSVDNKFMYVQCNREKFKKTLQGFSASTTMPAISFTDIRTIDIYLPSLPEQTAIGSFFQELDKVIAKQEEKVNQLKESKQTLLRKMFI